MPRQRLAARLAAWIAAGVVAACWSLAAPQRATADDAGTLGISVAPSIVAPAGGEAVLTIAVGPAGAVPEKGFVSLRGLPPGIALRDGHAVGPGWWAVPLSALPSIAAQIPADLAGRSEIVISLIAGDGELLAQARSTLVIESAQPAPAAAVASAAPSPTPAAAEPPEEQRARAERLLARGEAFLANGNIMGARDFFERAADAGSAVSALRLATTYDPAALKRLKVQGVAPDPALARKWYARALELGSSEAAEPLARLEKD